VSALAGCTRCGDHDGKGLAAARIDLAARRETGERAIEPTGIADRHLGQAAFEQILAVEMRAFAIGRGAGVHDDCLIGLEQAMQVGHRRVERKEVGERGRRRLAVRHQSVVAAQRSPIRIADRCDGRQPVESAAQDDGQKARIAAFGVCQLGQMRPGEQRAGSQQNFASRWGVEQRHGHLRKNSGVITKSAKA
jgi:hypothetical protein